MKKKFLFVLSIMFILSLCLGSISVSAEGNTDKSALGALIEEARAMKMDDYNADTSNWIAFQSMLGIAEGVYGDDTADQDKVDETVRKLQSRIDALGQKISSTTEESSVIAEIKVFLSEAKAMQMSDYSVSAYEWENLQNQIAVTENAIAGGNEAAIISAANVLYSIVDSIKAKPNTGYSGESIEVYPIQPQETYIKIEDIDDEKAVLIEQKEEKIMPKSTASFSKGGFIYLGCGSTVAISALAVVGVIGAALAFKKKED